MALRLALAILAWHLLAGDLALAHHAGPEPDPALPAEPDGGGSGNGAVTAVVLGLLVVTGVALAALKHVANRGSQDE